MKGLFIGAGEVSDRTKTLLQMAGFDITSIQYANSSAYITIPDKSNYRVTTHLDTFMQSVPNDRTEVYLNDQHIITVYTAKIDGKPPHADQCLSINIAGITAATKDVQIKEYLDTHQPQDAVLPKFQSSKQIGNVDNKQPKKHNYRFSGRCLII